MRKLCLSFVCPSCLSPVGVPRRHTCILWSLLYFSEEDCGGRHGLDSQTSSCSSSSEIGKPEGKGSLFGSREPTGFSNAHLFSTAWAHEGSRVYSAGEHTKCIIAPRVPQKYIPRMGQSPNPAKILVLTTPANYGSRLPC